MKVNTTVKPARLPYYSEEGAKFVHMVAQVVNSGQPYIVRANEKNLTTERIKWYNGLRFIRDRYPKQYTDLGLKDIINKRYEDYLIFMSTSSAMLVSLMKHIDSFFNSKHLKDGDVLDVCEVDISSLEWNKVREKLKMLPCTFDIDESTGRLMVIYNENTRTTTDAKPGRAD